MAGNGDFSAPEYGWVLVLAWDALGDLRGGILM